MTAKLELSLLGMVAATLKGEPVSGQVPAKSLALLCYLAVTGQAHSREKLAGLLWGDSPEDKAKASLRKSLSGLRKLSETALIINRQMIKGWSIGCHLFQPPPAKAIPETSSDIEPPWSEGSKRGCPKSLGQPLVSSGAER